MNQRIKEPQAEQEPVIDLSKICHEDKCCYWDDEAFCNCGADSHEILKWYRKNNAAPVSAKCEWVDLLAAFESVWLWMENQADGQSKGGHATFDLMMLREQRDIAHAAISKFKSKNFPPVVPQSEPVAWAHPSGGYLSARYMKEFATGLEKETYTIPLYAAPVDAKAIRAEALEEAAKVCRTAQAQGMQSIREAIEAAIRGMKESS